MTESEIIDLKEYLRENLKIKIQINEFRGEGSHHVVKLMLEDEIISESEDYAVN